MYTRYSVYRQAIPGESSFTNPRVKYKRLEHFGQCKSLLRMAERVRFELTVLSYTRVPGVHLKPLGHLSITLNGNALQQDVLHKRSIPFYQLKSDCGFKILAVTPQPQKKPGISPISS